MGATNQQKEAILYLHIVLLKKHRGDKSGAIQSVSSFIQCRQIAGYTWQLIRYPLNSSEIINLILGSFDSECLPLDI